MNKQGFREYNWATKEERSADPCDHTDELPDTEDHIMYNSIYMKYPEKGNT